MRTLLLLGVFGGIGHVDVGHDVMPNNKCWTFVKLRVFCSSFGFCFCFFLLHQWGNWSKMLWSIFGVKCFRNGTFELCRGVWVFWRESESRPLSWYLFHAKPQASWGTRTEVPVCNTTAWKTPHVHANLRPLQIVYSVGACYHWRPHSLGISFVAS